MIKNKKKIIELNGKSVKTIRHDSIIGYITVGGTYYGTEGFVYLFTIEKKQPFVTPTGSNENPLEFKTYQGRLGVNSLREIDVYRCIHGESDSYEPSEWFNSNLKHCPEGWMLIPYIMGYYCYFPKHIAKEVKKNWEKEDIIFHEWGQRMVWGVLTACQFYEGKIRSDMFGEKRNDCDKKSLSTKKELMHYHHVQESADNVLHTIFEMYPGSWKHPKQFKALLLDLLPEDKMRRNLIYLCIEEHIPEELIGKSQVTNVEFMILSKKLVKACGCRTALASEILRLWTDSLGIIINDLSEVSASKDISVHELTIGSASTCLKAIGIDTIGELLKYSKKELLHVPRLNKESVEKIVEALLKNGYALPSPEKVTENQKKGSANDFLTVGNCLYRYEGDSETIEVPACIRHIGCGAFENCINAEEILLPDNLQYIWDSAFSGCRNLKKLVIPESVLEFDAGALKDCNSLQEIVLPLDLYRYTYFKILPQTCRIVINDWKAYVSGKKKINIAPYMEGVNVETNEAYWKHIGHLWRPHLKVRIINASEGSLKSSFIKTVFYDTSMNELWSDDDEQQGPELNTLKKKGYSYSKEITINSDTGYSQQIAEESLPSILAMVFVNNALLNMTYITKTYSRR